MRNSNNFTTGTGLGFPNSQALNVSFRNLRLFGRVDAEGAAIILGLESHHIPVLIQEGLLRPLGKPAPNARKFFAAVEVWELAHDRAWLAKATQLLYEHWQEKNASRTAEAAVALN
ncbi:MAG: hypothetical protein HC841_02020 [Verrucomicrobiae bacterium]|nr:hypothetical protein [Verrucomicrobiae bacterium]